MSQQVTVTEHILLHQKMVPGATGQFTRLFNELVLSAKIITRAVNKAGLVDILGFTGDVNVQGEEVKKLDEYANRILIHRLARSGVLCAMASEENADIIEVPESLPRGDYIIIFDPLDGSSNIDVNVNIGTIFSIFKRISDPEAPLLSGDVLQKGCEQVAAGYILYGSSTMLVFTCGDGVHGFTLDPSVGEFLLSHPNIRIPEQGKIYSVNEGYERYWDRDTKKALAYFKSPKNALRKPYSGRYIGSLVADFHRNLLYGGIFMYPADLRDPKKPSGKLRLTCECNPMAFIVEQAGGLATDGSNRILDIEPEHLHQRVPFFCGSFNDVQMVQEIFQDEARRKKETVMRILGIETSCDETAVALVDNGQLLGEKLATQIDVHALFGGVVPEIASREHLRVLPRLYRELMDETGISPEDIDGVAVARGPGLLGSLLVGVSFAKGLCLSTGADLIGVNHLWAHLLAPGLTGELVFPALGLLVSGGHTHTYLVKSPVEFELLGRTLDDAAGEAFDKVAKLLNFPYPGGRYIDALAQEGEADKRLFPRPYIENMSLDFSFSGLKTAVANYVSTHPELVFPEMADPDMVAALSGEERERLARVCASFNWSVADTLRIKVDRALKQVGPVRSLIVAGGVAANSLVRETMGELAADHGLVLTLPDLSLCTDNGSMIAYAGWLLAKADRVHDLDLEAVPRGRVVPLDWMVRERR